MSYTNVYPSRINWENEPSINTPLNAVNLNKIDYAVYEHDRTLATWDTTKANQSDLLLSVKSIDYDDETGVFIFTWQNGTTKTVDLNIEKIPVSFSMNAQGVITMTTEDGTTYTADVGALIKTYTFTDSSVIDFTVTTDTSGNKTITAGIVAGSITETELQPQFLSDCQAAQRGAEIAENNAEDSAEDAEAWAVGQRNGVDVPSTDPAYENNAKYYSEMANPTVLANMSDVTLTSPTNGQALLYDAANDEWVNGDVAGSAADISYDNTSSGLTADDVQEAIDEINSNLDTLDGKVYKTDDSTETTIASDDLLPIYDTSATASKKITVANVVKATVSNPNLLDNPWFTVNQRGQSSYTGAIYTVDRWRGFNADTNLNVTDDGITLSGGTLTAHLYTELEVEASEKLYGKTVTYSIMLANGVVYSKTGVMPAEKPSSPFALCVMRDIPNGSIYNGVYVQTSGRIRCQIGSAANKELAVRAVKLELGSVSTLAMDTIPNYQQELAKCQRYFFRMYGSNTSLMAGMCVNGGNGANRFCFSLPVPMRTLAPSVTYSNLSDFKVSGSDGTGGVVPTTLTRVGNMTGVMYGVEMKATGFTTGQVVIFYSINTTGYIDFTADL